MTELQLKWSCPVCLGATLQKSTIRDSAPLTLDYCKRCGGIWFDHGEVQRLRRFKAEQLWQVVAQMEGVHRMHCHSCTALLERGADKCMDCGWVVELDCPSCGTPMQSAEYEGVRLDVCRKCRGVWFDRHELAEIWRMEFNAALQRRQHGNVAYGGAALVDALTYDPFLMYYAAHAAGHVLSAGAQGMGSALPDVAGAASDIAGAAGEAAASLFETIVDIIGGIFG